MAAFHSPASEGSLPTERESLPGLSAATISEPSGPRQRPMSKGTPKAEPQESFWVEKPFSPQWAATEGRASPKPKQSGR